MIIEHCSHLSNVHWLDLLLKEVYKMLLLNH
ncbi:MAG: hypothetical protein IJG81_07040 [Muribaculaceae bacterium]|nr:hypothetical protein [Muribaculaceae bacterium]